MLALLLSMSAVPTPAVPTPAVPTPAVPVAAAQVGSMVHRLSHDEFASVVECAFRGVRAAPDATLHATVSRCASTTDGRRRMDAHAAPIVDALTTAVAALMLSCQDSFAGTGTLMYCALAPPKEEAARVIAGSGVAAALLYFAEPFVAQTVESAPISPEFVQRRMYVGAAALAKSLLMAYSVEGGRSTLASAAA